MKNSETAAMHCKDFIEGLWLKESGTRKIIYQLSTEMSRPRADARAGSVRTNSPSSLTVAVLR